jgi:hypothetical protein
MSKVYYDSKNVRSYLMRNMLFINKPEPVITCCTCRFALSNSPIAVANYLAEKHGALKEHTKELRCLLPPYTFLRPEALRLRPDGSAPYPHLENDAVEAMRVCAAFSVFNSIGHATVALTYAGAWSVPELVYRALTVSQIWVSILLSVLILGITLQVSEERHGWATSGS